MSVSLTCVLTLNITKMSSLGLVLGKAEQENNLNIRIVIEFISITDKL